MAPDILFIQTGGTIDKDYPKTKGGYHFEIGPPAIANILAKIRPSIGFNYRIETVCTKDSQDMTSEDRLQLLDRITDCQEDKIIITHGTDSIIETAQFLQLNLQKLKKKHVVLTGSFLPETFRNSDADFNLGLAIGALLTLANASNGCGMHVYVALNGLLIPAMQATRKLDDGTFMIQDNLET